MCAQHSVCGRRVLGGHILCSHVKCVGSAYIVHGDLSHSRWSGVIHGAGGPLMAVTTGPLPRHFMRCFLRCYRLLAIKV